MSKVVKFDQGAPSEAETFVLSDLALTELSQRGSVLNMPQIIRGEAESLVPIEAFDLREVTGVPASAQKEVIPTLQEAEEGEGAVALADTAQASVEDNPKQEPDWQQSGAGWLEQARQEAERCLEEAQQQAEAIRQEAYNAGLQEGTQVAQQEVEMRFASLFASLQQACEELMEVRTQTLRQAEDDIVTLAFRVAEKILGAESCLNPTVLTAVLPQALEYLIAPGQLTIRIHPSDLEQAHALHQNALAQCEPGSAVQFQADESVGRGGCVIESAFGTIDARLDAQLGEVKQRFRDQIRHEGASS